MVCDMIDEMFILQGAFKELGVKNRPCANRAFLSTSGKVVMSW